MLRLRAGGWPVLALPIPNGIFLGGKSPAERTMAARIVAKMKSQGMLVPGMPDIVLAWRDGCALLELKAPESRDLFGKRRPAGRPSEAQKALAERAAELGINHTYCTSWEELRERLIEWGAGADQ